MSITPVNQSQLANGTTWTSPQVYSLGFTALAGQTLIISLAWKPTSVSITSVVTDGGDTITAVRAAANDGNGDGFRLQNFMLTLTANATQITVTSGTNATVHSYQFTALSGCASTPLDASSALHSQTAPSNVANAITATALTTVAPNAAVYSVVFATSTVANGTFSVGTGFSAVDTDPSATGFLHAEYLIQAIPGTLTPTFTHNTTTSADTAAWAFSIVPGASTAVPLAGQNSPTTVGSGGTSGGSSEVWWKTFTAYASGTATALNAYLTSVGVATGYQMGLYDMNGNLLAATANLGTPTVGLNTGTISNTPILYGTQYALAWQANSSVGLADDNTSFRANFTTNTFGTMPGTIPIGGGSAGAIGVPSIYVAGTLGAGAAGKPLGGPGRTQMHWR